MSHYFSKQPNTKSNPKSINYDFKGTRYSFKTDYGVFSKAHVDDATNLLLHHLTIQEGQKVLDLGCGYGVVGIILADYFKAKTTMIDINERALSLANDNAKQHSINVNIIHSDGFEEIEESFDHIVTNPPIRIGKEKLYELFTNARSHLKPQGTLWLVMHKKHGALSAIKYLEKYYTVNIVTKQKGFHVIACQNSLTI